jgi:hypothetical protein
VDYNFYAQDGWQIHPKVTFNAGVRYEFQHLPTPRVNNPALPLTAKLHQDKNNWGPRVGLAWEMLDRTVLRLGYGISYGRTENSTVSNFIVNNGIVQPSFQFRPDAVGAPAFPNVLASIPTIPGSVTINLASPDFVNPLIHTMNAEIERQFGSSFSIAVRYMGARGLRLPITRDTNLAPATQTRTLTVSDSNGVVQRTVTYPFYTNRINTAFGPLLTYETVVNTWYNSMVVQVNKRFSQGLQFMGYFTWAHALDDGQTSFTFLPGSGAVFDPYNRKADYGSSNFDQRKRFVFNSVWDPFSNVQGRIARPLLRGFKLSGILTLSNGFPQTGFLGGVGSQPGGISSGLNGSGNSSGRVPFIGRNSYIKPGLANIDARISRQFQFTESQSLEVVWEAFNVANHVNFNGVNSTQYNLVGTNLVPNATFLVPQSALSFPSTGNPRQMQVALRYRF